MQKGTNQILSLLTSISLLLLVYGLFILEEIPVKGYAASIYDQLPLRLYLILLFCYISSIILVLSCRNKKTIIILLLIHSTVLMIPYMLGYVSIGRYGEFSLMGLAENRGLFDHPDSSVISNLSPTGPLLVSALDLVSGLGRQTLSYFLPILFSIMFITGMYMLCRTYISREKLVGVVLLSSFLLYFWHFQFSTFPYYLSFCMVPIYLFVLRKAILDENRKMLISFPFMIALLPLAHPFIFAYLICFSLLLIVINEILDEKRDITKIFGFNVPAKDAVFILQGKKVLFLFFLTLILGSVLFWNYASRFSQTLPPDLSWHIQTLSVTSLTSMLGVESNLEFIHYFNLYYGKYYIPLIFIIINSVITWQNRKRFCHHYIHTYSYFLILYVVSFFLELVFLLNPFIHYPAERFVNLSFIIFAQIPLLAYSLYIIFLRKGHILGLASVILILGLLWTYGFFSCFSSPYTGGISEGVSQNEATGMQWLSSTKAVTGFPISEEGENIENKFISDSTGNLKDSDSFYAEISPGFVYIPGHYFESTAYLKNSSENDPWYFVVTTFSKELRKNKLEVETSDYVGNAIKLPERNSTCKIYDSLNIEIYAYST
ncbi:hypothetical protein MSSIT_3732 [Methanosarcina siciliae T4/M]|uniref:Glycosyltransferase RgtA/B/C/D-like domain-containing protein n=1 Tax=Methanosarcina siciliae T4/M TaxID=1434120 RepID=A0A0E3L9K9_9EURY|nr:hypothetical protein [Methanosarcina siciliae]AKB30451.1 hypothetical protein MSSIT_3732 [Methanosarcina siciliae T4/M]